MQLAETLPVTPAHFGMFSSQDAGNSGLLNLHNVRDSGLSPAPFRQFNDEFFPVHDRKYRYIYKQVNRNTNDHRNDNTRMETLAKRLKNARLAAGLSQGEAAKSAGMKQPSLSALENGGAKATSHITKFASIYGVNALWLAEGKGPRKPGDHTPTAEPARTITAKSATAAQILSALEGLLALGNVPMEVIAYPSRAALEARLSAALSGQASVPSEYRSHLDEPLSTEVQGLIRKGELLPELPGWDEYDTPEARAEHLHQLNPATGTGKR